MAAENAKRDGNRETAMLAVTNDASLDPTMLRVDSSTLRLLVTSTITGTPDMRLYSNTSKDGSGTNYIPIVDADGHFQVDVLTGGGGGTQYTEGDTDASITGTAIMWEDGSDILRAVSAAKPLPIGDAGGSLTVDNGGTFAVQIDGAALTSLQLLDDSITTLGTDTYTEAASKGVTIGAVRRDADTTLVDTTNEFGPLQMDANGRLKVEAFSGETLPVSLTSTTITGTVAVTQSGTWDEVGINDSGNVITVDGSGSAGIAAAGVITVQGIASMTPLQVGDNSASLSVDWNGTQPTTGSGTATGALRVELPTNGTGIVGLAAGTNAIGKLAANSGVDIGDVDVTSVAGTVTTKGIPSDIDINGSNANHADKYYTNAGAVTDGIIWSPAAGKRWHVTTLYIQVSAAATVTIEDDVVAGDVARWKGELAANSGVVLTYDKEHPFCSAEDAADLIITTSAGNVYVQAVGYEI